MLLERAQHLVRIDCCNSELKKAKSVPGFEQDRMPLLYHLCHPTTTDLVLDIKLWVPDMLICKASIAMNFGSGTAELPNQLSICRYTQST